MKSIIVLIIFLSINLFPQEGRRFYSASGTLTTEVDTLVTIIQPFDDDFGDLAMRQWVEVVLINDDTLEVSTSASFAAGFTFKKMPSGVIVSGGNGNDFLFRANPRIITNLYIRRFVISGGTGTVNYTWKITGF